MNCLILNKSSFHFLFFFFYFFLVDKQNYDIHNAYWEKKIFLLKETSGFFSGIQE